MKNTLKTHEIRKLVEKKTSQKVTLFPMETTSTTARKSRAFYFRIPFFVIVVLPILFGIIYYGLVASDRYVSRTQLTVRSAEGGVSNILGGLVGAVAGSNATSMEAYIVNEYILSRAIAAELQSILNIRAIYANPDADFLSRLWNNDTDEDLYEYYLNHVFAVYDPTKQIIDVNVEAFTPDDATAMTQTIVMLCDRLVNKIAQKSREDSLKFAKLEIKRAEERVEAARLALSDFRRKYGELDPVNSATAASGIVFSIEAEIARSQTELSTMQSYLRDDSAQVNAAKSRIKALKKQLAIERQKVAGPHGEGTFIPLLAEYEKLKIEDEFAKQAYTSTSAALELARAEASRKHIYLVAFVQPSLPDEASEPDRPRMILTIIICSLLIYGLFSLLSAAIREHARV